LKISVIIPTFGGRYISESLDSIFEQTVKPFEICITVDGKKETFEKIQKYFQEKGSNLDLVDGIYTGEYEGIQLKVKNRTENKGIGETLNDCILLSSGDVICWISDDDMFKPNKLEIQTKEYEKLVDKKRSILYGDYDLFDKKKNVPMWLIRGLPFEDLNDEKIAIWKSCFVNFSTTLIPREVFNIVGLFDPSKRFGEDYEWLLRAILVFDIFVKYIPGSFVNYGVDIDEQTTHKRINDIASNDEDSRQKVIELLKFKNLGSLEENEYCQRLPK